MWDRYFAVHDTNGDTGGEFVRGDESPGFPHPKRTHPTQIPADRSPMGIRHQCQCWVWAIFLEVEVLIEGRDPGVADPHRVGLPAAPRSPPGSVSQIPDVRGSRETLKSRRVR